MKEETKTLVEQTVKEILDLLGVSASTEVSFDKGASLYTVDVDSDNAGVLIGRRGETIDAVQLLLRQIVYKKTGEGVVVLVNVGDWRQRREDTLRMLADSAVLRIRETGEEQHIYDLTPGERRFIHLLLSEQEGIKTESEGEGRTRHLVVKSS